MGLFNLFKENRGEHITLDVACANVLIMLTEFLSAYGVNDFRELEFLEKKILLRNTFLSEHFDHLFENDLLKNIHDRIPIDPESQGQLLANSLNTINENSDNKFRFQFIFRISTIFNHSKNESDNFSIDQIHIMDVLEKGYKNNLPFKKQIVIQYNLFNDSTNIMMAVMKISDLKNPEIQVKEILKSNEEYKKYI